jgi:pilus assembly protein FimV
MSNGKNPLVLMMALSVPGAAHALGLGDIHVDSALNERLAAEIDIVGATADDLIGLRAAVANRDTFARYGADRPAFLSSATFKVSQDGQGRPVLAIRSTESFTEPAVNLLLDVRWGTGELVRQYTLLLDPPGFAAPRAAAAPVAATPVAATPLAATPLAATTETAPNTEATAPAAATAEPTAQQLNPTDDERAARKTTHLKVGAKATLRGIAWRVGERSESDLQRMMLAIFRANPTAFEGNINRLHLGAVLTIPSSAEVAAISKAEAKREIRSQMAAWRTTAHTPARTVAANAELPATPGLQTAGTAMPGTAAPGAETPAIESADSTTHSLIAQTDAANSDTADKATGKPAAETLDERIQSLERELTAMNRLLQSENAQMLALQQKPDRAVQAAPVVEASDTGESASDTSEPASAADDSQEQTAGKFPVLTSIAAGLGILAAALAAVYFRSRRRAALLRAAAIRKPFYVESSNADSAAGESSSQAFPGEAQHQANYMNQFVSRDYAEERAPQGPANTESASAAAGTDDPTQPALPTLSPIKAAGRSEAAGGSSPRNGQDTTVNMSVDTVNLRADPTIRVDPTRLDYNFLDLDMTAQHVQMPSVLNENAVFKERRTNLADVLRLAIEREPDRHDLRIKLLELYYSAAATNRQAFLEVVQKFARERDYLPTDQWDKIAFMGRQIASENPLFAAETTADDADLADCA